MRDTLEELSRVQVRDQKHPITLKIRHRSGASGVTTKSFDNVVLAMAALRGRMTPRGSARGSLEHAASMELGFLTARSNQVLGGGGRLSLANLRRVLKEPLVGGLLLHALLQNASFWTTINCLPFYVRERYELAASHYVFLVLIFAITCIVAAPCNEWQLRTFGHKGCIYMSSTLCIASITWLLLAEPKWFEASSHHFFIISVLPLVSWAFFASAASRGVSEWLECASPVHLQEEVFDLYAAALPGANATVAPFGALLYLVNSNIPFALVIVAEMVAVLIVWRLAQFQTPYKFNRKRVSSGGRAPEMANASVSLGNHPNELAHANKSWPMSPAMVKQLSRHDAN